MEGGEKVEIGGLGVINTIAAINKNNQSTSNEGFAGIFSSLMTEKSSEIDTALNDSITEEDLEGLLQFLKIEDIFDIEDGSQLLEQWIVDMDFSSVFQRLGLHDSVEEVDIDNVIIQLETTLNQFQTMSDNEIGKALNGDSRDLLKSIKILDLLTQQKYGDLEKGKFTDAIQLLIDKLGSFVKSDKQVSRDGYLQKIFSSLDDQLSGINPVKDGSIDAKPSTVRTDSFSGIIQHHQVSKPEQLAIALNQNDKHTTSSEMIKKFESILSKSHFSNIGGTQRLLIKLSPEHLGSLRIELLQRESGLVAKILTTTLTAKDLLESQINGLKQAFGNQNIQVERIEITQQMTQQQDRFLGKDQQQNSGRQGQERQDSHDTEEDNNTNLGFTLSLEDALVNMEV